MSETARCVVVAAIIIAVFAALAHSCQGQSILASKTLKYSGCEVPMHDSSFQGNKHHVGRCTLVDYHSPHATLYNGVIGMFLDICGILNLNPGVRNNKIKTQQPQFD